MLDSVNRDNCRRLKIEDLSGHHIVPAFWSPTEELAPFPFPGTYRWNSLQQICASLDVKRSIVCATPQIWQLEPLVYRTTRDIGVPVILTPPQNLPILKPFCEQAGVDLIVTSPDSVREIVDILKDIKEPPKAIVVIHKDTTTVPPTSSAPTSVMTLHELHLVPGLPVLYQEPEQANTTDFKQNKLMSWSEDITGTSHISLPDTWPVNIVDVPLTFQLSQNTCGDSFSIS